MNNDETEQSIEARSVASFIDQFPLHIRAKLAALVFEAGAAFASDKLSSEQCGDKDDTGIEPLTEAEQDIVDFLARVPATDEGHPVAFKGNEIADGVGRAYNYIKSLLTKDAPLRRRGLIDHRRNVGYWLVKPRAQFTLQNDPLCDVDQAILDLLARVDAPMVGPDIASAINNSLAYVKERLQPTMPLRAKGLIENKRRVGYFIKR